MNSAFLQCHWCNQKARVVFDPDSGLWELRLGFSKISNRFLDSLEKDWLEACHSECLTYLDTVQRSGKIACGRLNSTISVNSR